jgi:hypothetical protein
MHPFIPAETMLRHLTEQAERDRRYTLRRPRTRTRSQDIRRDGRHAYLGLAH